ncbi:hypothetical protein EYC84_011015 [Monilinia fructicola]|uniref:Uncharacterized protein n=1 Tax=Monilinia fructicola TaxID=38448 RepID=A0A5M9JBP9_MONFR|nr:hypothetical protein EYC84_011015 [Monilinia fructicola]
MDTKKKNPKISPSSFPDSSTPITQRTFCSFLHTIPYICSSYANQTTKIIEKAEEYWDKRSYTPCVRTDTLTYLSSSTNDASSNSETQQIWNISRLWISSS